MRFFFAHVPAGRYQLEVRLKEVQRVDAGGSQTGRPVVDLYVDGVRVAANVPGQTEKPEDPFVAHTLDLVVRRRGFELRVHGPVHSITLPCVRGMTLRQGERVVYRFDTGDARERAMWRPAELDPDEGRVRTTAYEGLLNSGVPLGGIGTGRVELLTNGTLGSFSCANNWDVPTYWSEGSFFGLWTNAAGRPAAVLLHPPRRAAGWELPTVAAVEYRGRYPLAELAYELKDMPLRVALQAQGTLTPADPDLSALPGATFRFTVENLGPRPADVALLMSLENLSGQGGYSYVKHDWTESFRERFDSCEGARQRLWQRGRLAGLLFDCRRRPRDRREQNAFTQYLLAAAGPGVSRCVSYNLLAERPAFWEAFAATGTLPAGDPQARGEDGVYRPAGAVARKLRLRPGQKAEATFVLAWKHAGHWTFRDDKNRGHAYARQAADIGAIAQAVTRTRRRRLDRVQLLQSMLDDSSLPRWLTTKLLNGAFPTTTNTVWTADGFFSVHESPADMAGAVGTLDQRLASHPFTFMFFPALDRCELEWFRRCQAKDGQIPHMIGNVYDQLGTNGTFFGLTGWPDLACSFIFQTYRHFLFRGDRRYLARNFPAYRKAIAWMRRTDNLGLKLPIGGCTYDYEAHEWKAGAPMIYNATVYLAALRAAVDAAGRLGRASEAREWQRCFEEGYATLMTRYWNGRYFRKWVRPDLGKENGNCFVSQLAGDWMTRVLGLEPLFSDEVVDRTLDSIVALNMAPHAPAIAMEATPEGELAALNAYVQQHEPFLGMELIYRGRVKQGLEVLQRRHEITWKINANPWGEALAVLVPSGQECNLPDYMTSPAAWNALYALAGASLDAEAARLALHPQLDGQSAARYPLFLHDAWLMLDVDLNRARPVKLAVQWRRPGNRRLPARARVEIEGHHPIEIELSGGCSE